jgi:MraZ protein
MFFGESRVSIDEKGRFAIPTEHRAHVATLSQNRLVVSYNPYEAGCLWLFAVDEWDRVRASVMALNSARAAHRDLQRRLVGAAAPVELDSSSRIVLPHSQRLQIALGKNGVLLGLDKKFELWSESAYQARMESPIAESQLTAEMLALPL